MELYRFSKAILALFISMSLTACSSGGGGDGTTSGGTTKGKVSLSGTVSSSSAGGSASTAKASGMLKSGAEPLGLTADALVTIRSFDKNNNLLQTIETLSSEGGGFNSEMEVQSTGGYLHVTVEKDGLTSFEKMFPYETLNDLKEGLDIMAEMDPLLTSVITFDSYSTQAIDFTKALAEDDFVSIAVVEKADSSRAIVANSDLKVAKASGNEVIWQLDMTKSSAAAQGIESLKVSVNNYNPADPEDARRFPTDLDADGNKLISQGFDFIDIKTNNGEPLVLEQSEAAKKAAAITYRVKRRVSDCSLVVRDEDESDPGVQVGFYAENWRTGRWERLTTASLYTDLGSAGTDPVRLATPDACDPSNLPYLVVTANDIDRIDYANTQWNTDVLHRLDDLTLTGDTVINACVEGTMNSVTNGGTKTGLYRQSIYLNNIDTGTMITRGGAYGYTKSDGSYKMNFDVRVASAVSDLAGAVATIRYNDPFTRVGANIDLTFGASTNSNGCYEVPDIDLADPLSCSVEGTVYNDVAGTVPASGKSIVTYQSGTYSGRQYSSTDSNGDFTIARIMCDSDYVLKSGSIIKSFNVSKTVSGDESSDDGDVVTMLPLTRPNSNPRTYIGASHTRVKPAWEVRLNSYGSDPDGDTVTYSWDDGSCGGSFVDSSGTDTSTSRNSIWTAPSSGADTTCTITSTVSDPYGATGTASRDVEVVVGNSAPVVSGMGVPSRISTLSKFSVFAYDWDWDGITPMTYSWSDNCGGSFDDSTLKRPTWTAPSVSVDTSCTVTVTVNDNDLSDPKSVTETKSLTVKANRAPVINSMIVPESIIAGSTTTANVYAYDPDGDIITYVLSAQCDGADDGTASGLSWTAPSATDWTQCALTLTVSDGLLSTVRTDVVYRDISTIPSCNLTYTLLASQIPADVPNLPASGGVGDVTFTVPQEVLDNPFINEACFPYLYAKTDEPWMNAISSYNTATDTFTANYDVWANGSQSTRSGTLTISGAGGWSKSVTLIQEVAP